MEMYLDLIETYDRHIDILSKRILNQEETIKFLKNELRIANIKNNRN